MRQWSVEARQLGQGKVELRIRGVFTTVHGSAPPPPMQWVETTPQETGIRPEFAEIDPRHEGRGVALCKEIGEVESAFSVGPALKPRPPAIRSGSLRVRPTTDRHDAAVNQAFPLDSSVFCTAAFEAPREQHCCRLLVRRRLKQKRGETNPLWLPLDVFRVQEMMTDEKHRPHFLSNTQFRHWSITVISCRMRLGLPPDRIQFRLKPSLARCKILSRL
ncbi:hypothetical protein CSOJ01_03568 [Colletotrichum sojae]|uniref:Uncharacterized protein n=1 Tax=Colletotrichum sojae TaxID=2175907 RepID=A0A8H6JLP2_9PEZI|nr:hypothetical protein CSOJ01_03568 [Colletotrichum sojae]